MLGTNGKGKFMLQLLLSRLDGRIQAFFQWSNKIKKRFLAADLDRSSFVTAAKGDRSKERDDACGCA